ncbi:MAG: hypothetical protein ACI9JY_002874 [Saprospiraceae bacterium]|jgi:hypothetical protein
MKYDRSIDPTQKWSVAISDLQSGHYLWQILVGEEKVIKRFYRI